MLTPTGFTADFIVMILFPASAAEFLTSRSLFLLLLLVYVGSLWLTRTPSVIKNSLTSELKLLNNIAAMSYGNPTLCVSGYILKRNLV